MGRPVTCVIAGLVTLLVMAAYAVAAQPGRGDPCGAALEKAGGEAAGGRFGVAAARLAAVSGECPEDYTLHLTLGYYHLRAGEFSEAEASYRVAATVSGGSFTARLGVGDSLAGQGRAAAAAELYRALREERPWSVKARLRWAYNRFQAGDHAVARAEYEAIHERAPDNVDALLGLGFCALREGRRAAARTLFRRAAALAPEDERAREGLDAARTLTSVFPWLVLAGALHDGHPWREWYGAGTLGLRLGFEERFLVESAYRYLHVGGREPTVGPASGAPWSETPRRERMAIGQHELHLAGGFDGPVWGFTGHGAYLFDRRCDGENSAGPAAHAGMAALAGRFRHWADFQLSAGWSFHDDFDVAQMQVGIRLPLLSWLDLLGMFEGQVADGRFWSSGGAELGFSGTGWALALGGRVGTRCRPVELDRGVIYNTVDRPSGSAWARLSADVGRGFVLLASYEFDRLLTPAREGDGGYRTGHVHGLVLGFGFRVR